MNNRLSFSETIREAYRIFKMQVLKIFILALIILMPIQIISGFEAQQMAGDASLQELQSIITTSESQEEIAEATRELLPRMLPYVIMDTILALLTAVFSLAIAKIVKDEGYNGALNPGYSNGGFVVLYETENGDGKVGSVSDYIGFGLKRLLKFALTVIVFAFLIFLGLMILVIPGIILLFALPLVEPVTAYTGKTGFSAFKTCFTVMLRQPTIIAYFLCSYVINYLMSAAFSSLLGFLPLSGIPLILVTAVFATLLSFALAMVQIVPLVAFLSRVKIEEDKENSQAN